VEPTSQVLDAAIPERWGLVQRSKNTVIYGLIRVAMAVIMRLPYQLTLAFCTLLGWLAPVVAVSDRRRAEEQLGQSIPELPLAERRRIIRAMFRHFARSAAELLHLGRFLNGSRAVELSPEHRAMLDAALAEGKGVMAVTGHIGNWELVAQRVASAGYPVTSIAKPLYDPRLTRLVHAFRTSFGMRVVWRGDAAASKDMLRVFKANEVLGMLIDQDTKVQGAFVPFFGRPAHTPTAAAALALRFSAPVLMVWGHRKGGRHVLHFERLQLPDSGDKEADTVTLTAQMTARLEHAIRQEPAQWVWLHRRWKKTPPA
jgi:Kdo2-lipid IVA lauroyltransferase/acyltransferase